MVKGSGNGWFRTKKGKKLYCWYNDAGDERSKVIGNASMTEAEGWLEVARLNLNKHVGKPDPKNATFGEVANHWRAYGKTKTGDDKDVSTKQADERNCRNYLLPQWGERIAKDMEAAEIQRWLDKQSRATFQASQHHERSLPARFEIWLHSRGASGEIDKYNPMKLVSAPVKSDFEAVQLSGSEATAVIRTISDPLVKVLVILIATTGMRISEALALTWDYIDWQKGRIRIRRKWNAQAKEYGEPKSAMSRKPVEMTKGLATVLEVWRQETMYAKGKDLLFPSYRLEGKQPRLGSMIVEDYLRPAAIAAGVLVQLDGRVYYEGELVTRFGFHNLRHGLATWLAEKGTDPEVIRWMLRHSTLDMTGHYVHAKARDAQEKYIAELGIADEVQNSDDGCTVRVQ